MIGITSTAKGKGLNKKPKTALSPTFQPPHLPSPCRANTKPPSPIGTSRSSHLSPETNIKSQNQLIYRNLKEYQCKPQNSPVWLVQGAAIYINIAAPCTTEIHTENQYFTLLVKPRVQPRFLHRLLILCFSCNPVIPKNKKSPKHFPFSVKISIFASVPRAERSNAAKPAQLPNRYRLPNFLLFKSYLPTDYKKTIVFMLKSGYYSTLSLWDTYRAAHPLYTILTPEYVNDFVNSMIEHAKVQGYLPIWALWGKENYCMIANHAIPVVVDAYLKGFNGFDAEEAYTAIKNSLTVNHPKSNWDIYMKYGYYPFDVIKEESVSRTVESCYDDYCAAQLARNLGKEEDYTYFLKRSGFYKNLFDSRLGLLRGRDSKGNWRTPFNPFLLSHAGTSGGDFTEGNSWQYTWHVQHDIKGLIELMGGNEKFVQKLDSLFFLETRANNTGFTSDVTGLIGQYAHGNEPSHHVAYLYSYADRKDKTQFLIREIFDRFYLSKPDGLCGNDDCGQMSAWHIFSAMGFYPVDPISGEYVIGAPQLDKVVLTLPKGKTFTMEAKGLSTANKYVHSIELNGVPLTGLTIAHKDIMKGGHLIFVMTDKP